MISSRGDPICSNESWRQVLGIADQLAACVRASGELNRRFGWLDARLCAQASRHTIETELTSGACHPHPGIVALCPSSSVIFASSNRPSPERSLMRACSWPLSPGNGCRPIRCSCCRKQLVSGTETVRLDNSAVPYFCTAPGGVRRALAQSIEAHDTVILHSHFTGYDRRLPPAAIRDRRKFKTVVHLHSNALASPAQAIKPTIKDVVKIRMLGRYAYDRFIAVADCPLPMPYSTRACRATTSSRSQWNSRRPFRARLGEARRRGQRWGSRTATPLCCFGRDPYLKGLDLFLEAAASRGQGPG